MISVDFKDFNSMVSFARQLLDLASPQAAGSVTENHGQASSVSVRETPLLAASDPKGTVSDQPAAAVPAAPVTAPVAQQVTAAAPAASPVPASVPAASPAPAPTSVPTVTQTYTSDDLARAAMALMDSGHQSSLVGLLKQFGVTALPELRPEQFGAFATALRGMGAPI